MEFEGEILSPPPGADSPYQGEMSRSDKGGRDGRMAEGQPGEGKTAEMQAFSTENTQIPTIFPSSVICFANATFPQGKAVCTFKFQFEGVKKSCFAPGRGTFQRRKVPKVLRGDPGPPAERCDCPGDLRRSCPGWSCAFAPGVTPWCRRDTDAMCNCKQAPKCTS